MFNDLVHYNSCNALHLVWYMEPQTQGEHVTFWFNDLFFLMLNKTCPNTRSASIMTEEDWEIVV
jgi:hypothetical protein